MQAWWRVLRGIRPYKFSVILSLICALGVGLSYASGIVVPKRGSCVLRIVQRKLYAMKLEGVANQSFDAVAAQFDALVATARLRDQR